MKLRQENNFAISSLTSSLQYCLDVCKIRLIVQQSAATVVKCIRWTLEFRALRAKILDIYEPSESPLIAPFFILAETALFLRGIKKLEQ
jgi:hypothetical protein